MKKIITLLVFLNSCSFDPAIVKAAGIRRVAGSRLVSCLRSPPGRPFNEERCKEESRKYCLSQGTYPSCAFDDAYWEYQNEIAKSR